MNHKRKKILHFIDSGGLYGAESVILNLSRETIAHGKFEPVIGCIVPNLATPNDLYHRSLGLGLPAVKIQIRNLLLWIDIFKAARKLKTMGIYLIHCHGYKAFVFAFLIGKLNRIPVISTCHLWFLQGDPPLKMRIMIKCELFLYRFAPIVISVSDPIRQFLLTSGLDARKIQLIHNGIYLSDYQADEEHSIHSLKAELCLENNPFVVLNVGRLSLQKAQKTIIDAAGLIGDTKIPVRFFIVGDGELRSELKRHIIENRLTHIVKLLGFIEDIRALLTISDLFVLPSVDEGMPMSLLEAVACNIPVVATMVGDIPKIIQNGISGIAVPVHDAAALAKAILQLKDAPKMRTRMAAAALEKVRREYASTHMYDQYQKVYDDVLACS